MGELYRQKTMSPDTLLGHIDPDGKVYRSRFGPDDYAGRVELATGKVFRNRVGPDEYVGRVDQQTGQIFRQVPIGPDEYIGKVDAEGHIFANRPMAPDDYAGQIRNMQSKAEAGAALLLLF